MATCAATTHSGARCSTAAAADSSGLCAHHARMTRLLALAPKASAPGPNAPNATMSTPSPAARVPTTAVAATVARLTARPSSVDSVLYNSATTPSLHTLQPSAQSIAATGAAPTTPDDEMALLPNEGTLAAVGCSFVFPAAVGLPSLPGTLVVTSYRLRFEPATAALRSPGHLHRLLDDALVGVPRAGVSKLVYPQAAGAATRSKYDAAMPTQLEVRFKDLRSWTLGGDVSTLMLTLNRHVFVDSPLSLYAFNSGVSHAHARERQGHDIYDLYTDFARMGVALGSGPFRVTEQNRSYTMCPTYPPLLVVPAAMTDHEVASVAAFRSKGRLPICSYVHAPTSASIWRCAQPKRGLLNAQSAADDRHVMLLAASNRHHKRVWVADCRPELNARVNKLTGGGTESANHAHATVSFLNIANIHAMRESLAAVRALAASGNADLDFHWLTRVEDTKWLHHVRLVLAGALRVADAVATKGTTVLVHCSDGWDRTGQLCALAQLLLDRHYRTLEGFMHVIEKEWVRVGHKFHDRVGPGVSETEEQSPVFLQFLDCVWQLLRQFPTYFEFTGELLTCIADATFSGRYGTFLGNCDRERTAWGLSTRTPSLWTHVLAHRATYANPFYRPGGATDSVLLPPVSTVLRQVTLWSEYYFRGATLPAVPAGNPSPPLFNAGPVPTAKTNHEDLGLAMAAARRRIQVLEDELRDARAAVAAARVSVTQGPPLPPSPPMGLQYSVPAAPPLLTSTAAVEFHARKLSGSSSSSDSSSPTSAPQSNVATWTCGLCSKLNGNESFKCAVCGRPPPPATV